MEPLLTKSLFVQGMSCEALLWFLAREKDALPPPSEHALTIMRQGAEIGRLACGLNPDGIGVRGKTAEAVLLTKRLRARDAPLYEATVQHGRLLCKADILDGTTLIEVKSSTKVKPEHLLDVAFQTYVLREEGYPIKSVVLRHIDRDYVRQGALDLEAFFTDEDVTGQVEELLETIEEDIERLLAVMDGKRPSLEGHPHGCACDALITLPENSVAELSRADTQALLNQGYQTIEEVPEELLSKNQRIQQQCVCTGNPYTDQKMLRRWLDTLKMPIVHLDFETLGAAIPPYDGMRPYEQLPFQFSAHIEHADGTVEHREFLGDGKSDPRPALLAALSRLPTQGCFLAHHAPFEKRVLSRLAEQFPEHADFLVKAKEGMRDLIVPFRRFWYHDAKQHGSCSLKAVLPALTAKTYDGLAVADGTAAQAAYGKLAGCDAEVAEQIREDLLEYCGQDTQAMVDVLAVLRKSC